jgi:hypothetical protein
MALLPPPPTQDQSGSYAWLDWYRQLRNYISQQGSIPWSVIDFSGSDIDDITSRSHQSLQSIQGGTPGEYYHLTQAQQSYLEILLGFSHNVTITASTFSIPTTAVGVTNYYCDTTSNSITITMPSPASNSNTYNIKKIASSNTVTVAPYSTETIEGGATASWTEINESITLASDGTNWRII